MQIQMENKRWYYIINKINQTQLDYVCATCKRFIAGVEVLNNTNPSSEIIIWGKLISLGSIKTSGVSILLLPNLILQGSRRIATFNKLYNYLRI